MKTQGAGGQSQTGLQQLQTEKISIYSMRKNNGKIILKTVTSKIFVPISLSMNENGRNEYLKWTIFLLMG